MTTTASVMGRPVVRAVHGADVRERAVRARTDPELFFSDRKADRDARTGVRVA
ncbi:hypothetical protein [Streptomyces sp. NPDC005407]|uniref:hypothetical protein n=1 Tax=Streptomyces sp. NPDC005407 TaxID=3155340 RepID=UPI0033B71C7B